MAPPSVPWLVLIALALTGCEGQRPCRPPAVLPPDPLFEVGRAGPPDEFLRPTHIVELAVDPVRPRLYGAGVTGLQVFDLAGGIPTFVGQFHGLSRAYDHVAVLPDGKVALSSRERGVDLVTVHGSDAEAWRSFARLRGGSASGLVAIDELLYVLDHRGTVGVYRPTARTPRRVAELTGLGDPWRGVRAGDHVYVADALGSVVVLDVSRPEEPEIAGRLALSAGARDVDVDRDTLFVALGADGLATFSLDDPIAPAPLATLAFDAPVVSVDAREGWAWLATTTAIQVVDARSPSRPLPTAGQPTAEWVMDVWADARGQFTAEWQTVGSYRFTEATAAPDVDLDRAELAWVDGRAELRVTNRGRAPLHLTGFRAPEGVTVAGLPRRPLPAGGDLVLDLRAGPDAEAGSLCLAFDDPDEARIVVPLGTDASDVAIGESAPDFTLTDLDGVTHRLSDQLGKPVVLAYFATW